MQSLGSTTYSCQRSPVFAKRCFIVDAEVVMGGQALQISLTKRKKILVGKTISVALIPTHIYSIEFRLSSKSTCQDICPV